MSSSSSSYRNALVAISNRTGSPLSSLLVSFALLHELTAIAPLVGVFYTARSLHVGERIVNQYTHDARQPAGWMTDQFSKWVDEGEKWAHRVGHRYGVFGLDKPVDHANGHLSERLAGDVANAVLAYVVTKALLPVRVGLSLYLSPPFSRRIVEPIRRRIFTAKGSANKWQVGFLISFMMIPLAAPVVAQGTDDRQRN